MAKNILQKTKDEIYQTILLYPSKSDYTIADETGVSAPYVWKTRQKMNKAQDYELTRNAAGLFLSEFQTCSDRLKSYISELEDYKSQEKTIIKTSKEGGSWSETVPLDPTDKAFLIKLQIDATKQILHMVAQPRLITVVRAMREQKFKKPEFNGK